MIMTLEQKAKAYDEALETARKINSGEGVAAPSGWTVCEVIFPELKESEDERIRKRIIALVNAHGQGMYKDDMLTWLEQQKTIDVLDKEEREFADNVDSYRKDMDEFYKKGYDAGREAEKQYWLEKQGEQKPADNFKQKFKVGDWVTNGLCAWRIDSIDEDMYYTNHCGIDCGGDIKSIDEEYHIWTIQDAKDGDVLAEDTCTFIIKKLNHDLTAEIYCCLYDDGDFELNSNLGFDDTCTYPATKEQRDLLFKKMKEAGYEWDADKKELKKADVELTDFEKSLKHIMIETLECGDTHNLKADAEMLLRFAQKPAWSEEDEKMLNHIIGLLEGLPNLHNWLKSLKGRVQPKNHWKPSKEQMEALAWALSLAKNCGEECAFDLRTLQDQLKKLTEE